MKLIKFVSYASLVVISITALLLVSAPFRFPGSGIAWKPVVLFLLPAVVIVVLLFIKPLLSRKIFIALILSFTVVAVLGTITHWMSPIILVVFLVACLALYFSDDNYRLNFHHK